MPADQLRGGGAAHDADLRDLDVRLRQRAGADRLQRGAVVEVPLLPLRQSDGRGGRSRSSPPWIAPSRRCCFRRGWRRPRRRVIGLAKAGDEVVCSAAIYGGTLHLLADLLSKFGVTSRFVSLEELAEPDRIIGDRTRLVWFESPINPTLRCVDVRRIADACRARGVTVGHRQHVCEPDQPAAAGARRRPGDAERDEISERPQRRHRRRGRGAAALLAPMEKATAACSGRSWIRTPAYALGRGLKTLPLRIARHNANAQAVAEFLARDRARPPGPVSRPGVASRSRDRAAADERVRRHGVRRSRRRLSRRPSASTTG